MLFRRQIAVREWFLGVQGFSVCSGRSWLWSRACSHPYPGGPPAWQHILQAAPKLTSAPKQSHTHRSWTSEMPVLPRLYHPRNVPVPVRGCSFHSENAGIRLQPALQARIPKRLWRLSDSWRGGAAGAAGRGGGGDAGGGAGGAGVPHPDFAAPRLHTGAGTGVGGVQGGNVQPAGRPVRHLREGADGAVLVLPHQVPAPAATAPCGSTLTAPLLGSLAGMAGT